LVITAWLVVGHAFLGLLYWLLLQIPESNVFMLVSSVAVAIAMVFWAGAVQAAALFGWQDGATPAGVTGAALRRAAWIVPPLVVFAVIWIATDYAYQWLSAYRGEIDAWFIAKGGWTNMEWLHTTLGWVVWFVRFGCGVSLGAALLAGLMKAGARTVASVSWLARAFDWKNLALTTIVLFVGWWLPWRFVVGWRPASLPVSWVQPAFASLKLGLVFVVMNAAWAFLLRRASRT
jgi:hypothetical protein